MVANENSGKQKSKRVKVRERERGGSAPSFLPRPSTFFPRSSAARRTDPLTEGLEQVITILYTSAVVVNIILIVEECCFFESFHLCCFEKD